MAASRPLPKEGPVPMDGTSFGYLLEVWEYLNTFSKSLNFTSLPTIDNLIAAVKICDPSYKTVIDYSRSLETSWEFIASQKIISNHPAMLPKKSTEILNKVGIALTSILMKEYEKIMGIDLCESLVGQIKVPINSCTWRDIARVVLMASVCREVGLNDIEIAKLIKGNGFVTCPETADRRALRLVKRRMISVFVARHEFQESSYGFNSGIVVRIPSPSNPIPETGVVSWTVLLSSLLQVPDSNGWLIFEIIKAAAIAVCSADCSSSAKKVQTALFNCLTDRSFNMSDGSVAKSVALTILQNELVAHSDSSSAEFKIMASNDLYDKLLLFYDGSSDMVPLSAFDLWAKQLRDAVRRCNVEEVEGNKSSEPLDISEKNTGDDWEIDGVDDKNLLKDDNRMSIGSVSEIKEVETNVDDAAAAEQLSIAMQRCYLVIRELMHHPDSRAFCNPVDINTIPSYYRYVTHPVSLSDIRKHLVNGDYCNSISSFYLDVIFLLENAFAYNPEASPVKLVAQKLSIIFERLFLEMVLTLENPLPSDGCCHTCRVVSLTIETKLIICDRCEASYHLSCLDPPMSVLPASIWFCIPCVEQRNLAHVHPYRTASVTHPLHPDCVGEVVGIEQIKETVMFVVEFDNARELWNGKKVREFTRSRNSFSSIIEGSEEASGSPYGYDLEDYDRVCGIVKGYSGWGSAHYLTASALISAHSKIARARSEDDSNFTMFVSALVALGADDISVSQEINNSMNEWIIILKALQQKALATPYLTEVVDMFENEIDEKFIQQISEDVQNGTVSLETLGLRSNQSGRTSNGIVARNSSVSINDAKEEINNKGNKKASKGDEKKSSHRERADAIWDNEMLLELDASIELQETDEDRELKLLSRQKGREDAIITHFLVNDALVMAEAMAKQEETDPEYIQLKSEVEHFSVAVLPAVVKYCAARPSDILLADEWSTGWEVKMAALQDNLDKQSREGSGFNIEVCRICGTEENYLASPFVLGQTYAEFLSDTYDDSLGVLVNDSSISIGLATDTGIKGFKARNKVMKGIMWTPYNKLEAELELAKFKTQPNVCMKVGSAIAHECCANMIFVNRQQLRDKEKRIEEQHIVEILLGLGKAKNTRLGVDRDGSKYWIFVGSNHLFVSGQYTKNDGNKFQYDIISPCTWYIYKTDEEIGKIIMWLNPYHSSEKILRRLLILIYPNALSLAEASCSNKHDESFEVVITAEVIETEDVDLSLVESESADNSDDNSVELETVNKSTESEVDEGKDDVDEQDYKGSNDNSDLQVESLNEETVKRNGSFDKTEDRQSKRQRTNRDNYFRENYLDTSVKRPSGFWTKDKCKEEASKYESKKEFLDNCTSAYQVSRSKGWLVEICSHMSEGRQPKGYWTKERCALEAQKYHSRVEFIEQSNSAYQIARREGWLDEICHFRDNKQKSKVIKPLYRRGDRVIVKVNNDYDFEAKIIESKSIKQFNNISRYYKVRFEKWGESYDGWYNAVRISNLEHLACYLVEIPDTLKTLNAFNHLPENYRMPDGFVITFSNSWTSIGMLRTAMLMVQAALPAGSIDERSEERWGGASHRYFTSVWREAVMLVISLAKLQ